MKAAAKTKPPKAEATAKIPPIVQDKPAPPGSRPDPEAVERIRALRSRIGACDAEIIPLQLAHRTETQFFRAQVTSRMSSDTYPDDSVEKLWTIYEREVEERGEVGYAYRDLQELHERYEAVREPYVEKVKERTKLREQLLEAVRIEGPKLTIALRESGVAIRQRAVDAIAPFCASRAEAEEVADSTTKVQDFILAEFRWQSAHHGADSHAYFVSAWEMLNSAQEAAASLQT